MIKARLAKLEKAIPADGSCPLCRRQRPNREAQAAERAEFRKLAEAQIAKLLPQVGGDRDAALAVLKEHAPALAYMGGLTPPPANACRACGQTPPLSAKELRTKAEEIITRLLPFCGGDRSAALELLREHAPALSEYI